MLFSLDFANGDLFPPTREEIKEILKQKKDKEKKEQLAKKKEQLDEKKRKDEEVSKKQLDEKKRKDEKEEERQFEEEFEKRRAILSYEYYSDKIQDDNTENMLTYFTDCWIKDYYNLSVDSFINHVLCQFEEFEGCCY